MTISQSKRFSNGRSVRRKVLGKEHVDPQLQNSIGNELLEPFQKFVTEVAWGDVWGRKGLTLKQRSMLTISLLAELNRPHELDANMRGAKNNGVTLMEIREVLLHTSMYAGFPSAFDGVRSALKVYTPKITLPKKSKLIKKNK